MRLAGGAYSGYERFIIRATDGIATVVIDNPPINLMDVEMMGELGKLAGDLSSDETIKVVIVESRNPDFFIAHADVDRIITYPVPSAAVRKADLNGLHRIMERWRTMPKATIAKIEGIARGGGSEFALSLDMRFAAVGRTILGQPEVALGIIPGATGTQRLSRLLGRSRALEVILSCRDLTAEEACTYGYINKALPPEELGPFVSSLARRIASFPLSAIASAKAAVDAADTSVKDGLLEETFHWEEAFRKPVAIERLRRFLIHGGQTRDGELDLQGLIGNL